MSTYRITERSLIYISAGMSGKKMCLGQLQRDFFFFLIKKMYFFARFYFFFFLSPEEYILWSYIDFDCFPILL